MNRTRAIEAVTMMLEELGEDVDRDGLKDTPMRVVKSWRELFGGYDENPADHLERVFDEAHDQLIAVHNIEFFSTCEHHILPFFGTCDVAYLPGEGGGVVGLSKIARVVNGYARRLQVQERLTDQIADAIEKRLEARAVAVRIRAEHFCMRARGVRNNKASMMTTSLRGALKNDPTLRAEWLRCLPA